MSTESPRLEESSNSGLPIGSHYSTTRWVETLKKFAQLDDILSKFGAPLE
jgi:hypothetical protein